MKKQRGITLIALVITIIILIILAGVSINLIFDENGILTKAKTAKEDYGVSVILEELELLKMNMRLKNKELNIENYLGELQKTDTISCTVDQIDKADKNNAYVVLNEKYMFLIEDTNQNNVIITYEGIVGKLKPRIENVVVDNTNNSISVKVESKRAENYKFYIKDSLEKEYELKEENNTGVYTYINLTQNVMYYIKVEVINEEGTVTKELTSFTTNVKLEASEVNDKKIVLTAKITENEKEISSYKFYVNETLIQTIETNDTSAAYTWTSTFGDHEAYVIVTDVEGNESVSETISFTDYTIKEEEELVAFTNSVNNGKTYENKTIMLIADLDLSSVCGEGIGSWLPIGPTTANPFKGIFDGDNHTIEKLYISTTNKSKGLFGVIDNATIKNLIITNSSIQGSYYIGTIAAVLKSSTIENVHITSSVTVTATTPNDQGCYVGGIAGQTLEMSTITNSSNNASVIGNGNYVAGITGVFSGTIDQCYNGGLITNAKEDGGFTGGIIGINYGDTTISNSYNKGDVIGNSLFGGIVGGHHSTQGNVNITNCYNTGNVGNENNTSEIISSAYEKVTITNCYTKTDEITATNLGEAYVEDEDVINNGYPILGWQAK